MLRKSAVMVAALWGGMWASELRATAAQLVTAAIPAEARWVMHLNVDAVRGTTLWELVRIKFVEPQPEEFATKVAAIETITGARLPRDLRSLTLFGTAFDENTLGLLIYAPLNEERVTSILKLDPEFRSNDHHGHRILTWRDKDRNRLMYASFYRGDVVIVSPSPRTVALTLDTMDGKVPATKNARLLPPPPSALAPTPPAGSTALPAEAAPPNAAASAGPILWIASTHVSDLPRAQPVESPFLLQVDTASLGLGVSGDQLWVRAGLVATTEKAAQQLSAAADGLKAMIALAASDDRAQARMRLLASALQSLSIRNEGKELSAHWSVGMDKVDALLEGIRPAPAAPATKPTPAQK